MALTHLLTAFKSTSIMARVGIAVAVLAVALLLIGGAAGIVSHFKDAAYQKREAQREAERTQLETEKAALQAEKQKALTDAADANARADTYRQVAESKRTDRAQTVKELSQIEVDHKQQKAEVEASGGSMSDAQLRDELCKRLARRGYKPCTN